MIVMLMAMMMRWIVTVRADFWQQRFDDGVSRLGRWLSMGLMIRWGSSRTNVQEYVLDGWFANACDLQGRWQLRCTVRDALRLYTAPSLNALVTFKINLAI